MEKMQAADLVKNVLPAWGDSWSGAVVSMLADPAELAIIRTLAADLRRHGRFRRPVILSPAGDMVYNGMHRIVTSICCGTPVCIQLGYEERDGIEITEVTLRPGADADDFLFRSFPVSDDEWAEADLISGGAGWDWSFSYFWPFARKDVLLAAIQAWADSNKTTVEIVSVQPGEWL